MVDWAPDLTVPKYGPPNMAAELYNMIRGVPKAYQEGKTNEFTNQKEEFERDVERPYKKRTLERADLAGELTQRVMQQRFDELQNDPGGGGGGFDSSDSGATPAQRIMQGTGGAKSGKSVSELIQGTPGFADQPGAAAAIERHLGIKPGAPLTAAEAEAVGKIIADAQDAPPASTGSTGANALPPDPRRSAPPSMSPMPGPPGAAPGFTPSAPPGAPPGAQVAQAGPPQAGPPQSYVTPLQQFGVGPQPAPPRPGQPKLWPPEKIQAVRAQAKRIDEMANFGGPMAAGDKERAKRMYEAAQKAEDALTDVAKKREEATDPAVQAENTRKEIEKGNITESIKEQKAIQMQARTADDSNQKLAVLRTEMSDPNFFTGAGHELVNKYREWLVSMGKDPDAARSVQTFNKTVNDLLGEKIRTMASSGYSRIQVAEIRQLQKAIANMEASPATNRYLIEEMSRLHQNEIKLGRLANEYVKTHQYLDAGWPAAKEAFLAQPAQRLFTQREIDHPESIAPPYFPSAMYHDIAKTKAFIKSQGLKDTDPVAVDDTRRQPGPDGILPRKLVPAGHLLKITVDTPGGR